MNAFRKKEKILKSNKISLSTRIRAFNAYVASIFLYNSELWTLTKIKEKKINTFQRNLLRKIMNIKWPQIMTNEELMTDKLVRHHQKETTVLVWTCISTR